MHVNYQEDKNNDCPYVEHCITRGKYCYWMMYSAVWIHILLIEYSIVYNHGVFL